MKPGLSFHSAYRQQATLGLAAPVDFIYSLLCGEIFSLHIMVIAATLKYHLPSSLLQNYDRF